MELSVDKFTFITYLAKRLVMVRLGNHVDVSTETYIWMNINMIVFHLFFAISLIITLPINTHSFIPGPRSM